MLSRKALTGFARPPFFLNPGSAPEGSVWLQRLILFQMSHNNFVLDQTADAYKHRQ